ncbi:MAG: hypothetical protein K8I82_00690 [Anaerolineae bacterium]|nr:hypothetical protein [Anaerolineae bacterium]
MPIDIRWHIKHRVLLIRPYGEITLEQIKTYNEELRQYLAEGTRPIHLIAMPEKIDRLPPTLKGVIDTLFIYREPGIGWNIVVGDRSILTKFFTSTLGQLYKLHVAWADSFAEAMEILVKEDQSLENRLPDSDLPLDFTSV